MPTVRRIQKPMIQMFAVRGTFSGVSYFMTSLTLSECADQLHFARTNEASSFADRVQRQVNEKRANAIFDEYLRKPGLRFFNSLVVVLTPKEGTDTGYYRFEPFEDPEGNAIQSVGVLEVLSDIDRIVVDGQHRLHALRRANEHTKQPEYDASIGLTEVKVPVVFLTFDDVEGEYRPGRRVPQIGRAVADRSRKVFIDLNKTAKPVDKNSLLILDDSDFSAIAARHLIETDPTLELYTKWSDAGSTLADADPYFTNIFLLDQYVELVFANGVIDKISEMYALSLTDERERAIREWFLGPLDERDGLVPHDMIIDFFEKVSFFGSWMSDIRSILQGDPPKQPELARTKTAQRKEIRKLHQTHLLGTVAGQRAAFIAALKAYRHLGDDDPQSRWKLALGRLSDIHDRGFFSRTDELWEELLVRPGNRMKVNEVETASSVLEHLIRGVSVEEARGLIRPEDGKGTSETLTNYTRVLSQLE